MRLLDRIVQAPEAVAAPPGETGNGRFPGTGTLAAQVAACPLRYVLADGVTELCMRLAFESDSILGSSVELVRVPAPTLWVEFADAARHRAPAAAEHPDTANMVPGRRVGFLVTSDASGRKGDINMCWEEHGLNPSVAPFTVEYDLDDETFAKTHAGGSDVVIDVSLRHVPALAALFARIRFRLRPEWRARYAEGDGARFREAMLRAVRPITVDVPFFAVFCLLLSSKRALRQESVDRSRLNAARERRGKPPLLDHVELTMNLVGSEGSARGDARDRASPRLHFVRGHLVRRGNTIFWRTSHMRGAAEKGSIKSRTVSMRLGE